MAFPIVIDDVPLAVVTDGVPVIDTLPVIAGSCPIKTESVPLANVHVLLVDAVPVMITEPETFIGVVNGLICDESVTFGREVTVTAGIRPIVTESVPDANAVCDTLTEVVKGLACEANVILGNDVTIIEPDALTGVVNGLTCEVKLTNGS